MLRRRRRLAHAIFSVSRETSSSLPRPRGCRLWFTALKAAPLPRPISFTCCCTILCSGFCSQLFQKKRRKTKQNKGRVSAERTNPADLGFHGVCWVFVTHSLPQLLPLLPPSLSKSCSKGQARHIKVTLSVFFFFFQNVWLWLVNDAEQKWEIVTLCFIL